MKQGGRPLTDWAALAPHLDALLTLPAAARPARIAEIAANDSELAEQLQELLAERDAASRHGFLDGSAVPGVLPLRVKAGDRLGAWTLEAPLGEGGMGRVWRARRNDGRFEGQAAVKLLKASLADTAAQERFRREGALLARLHHPGIAGLLDAGLGPHGEPYLVLELVQGQPIDRHVATQSLGLRERVALFVQVAEAVAAAHAQLVLHRDLKPSNILVDDAGRIKLLDFGIGRLLQGDEAEDGTLTAVGALALTSRYAAPEQFESGTLSTATDVYQLGLVFFELLTGVHPSGLEHGTLADYMRWAAQDGTPLASATVQRLSATDRPPNPIQPGSPGALRGDLDTILSKALRRDPATRYTSAAALADDLRRHLALQPISARPDTLGYRAGRWVQRNRTLAAVTALALLGVGAGVAAALVQSREALVQATLARQQQQAAEAAALQAQRERSNAQTQQANADAARAAAEAERLRAETQRIRAEAESARAAAAQRSAEAAASQARAAAAAEAAQRRTAEEALIARAAISEFMDLVLSEGVALNTPLTMSQLLQRAEQMALTNFAERPEPLTQVRQKLAAIYFNAGDTPQAHRLLSLAVAQVESVKDPVARARLECEHGELQNFMQDTAGARRTLAQALERSGSNAAARFVCLRLALRMAQTTQARAVAVAELDEGIRRFVGNPGVDTTVRWISMNMLGVALQDMGRWSDADRTYVERQAEIDKAGREQGNVSRGGYNNHGSLLLAMGDYRRGAALLQRAMVLSVQSGSGATPSLAQSLNLARLLHAMGRTEEAVALMDPLAKHFTAPEDSLRLAIVHLARVDMALDSGDLETARQVWARVQPELAAAARRPPSFLVQNVLGGAAAVGARIALAEGRAVEASERVAAELAKPRYAQQSPDPISATLHLVHSEALLARADLAAARPAAEAAVAHARTLQDRLPHSGRTARALAMLARVHDAQGDAVQARSLREEAARHFAATVDATQRERLEVERLLAAVPKPPPTGASVQGR